MNAERTATRHVVVADDHAPMRAMLAKALSKRGFRVDTAENGDALLEVIDQTRPPPDVAITDVYMPGRDGLSAASTLREAYPDLHIIVVSAFRSAEVDARARSIGVDAILDKPFDILELIDLVESLEPR